ncbi:mycofactocin-coupled SDR family oxidoreductase [Pseudonocardia sp. GCM10023141]|uniref:mycofactocin-coupled SDR family oxidoreductase n=1 Tax=Pseudonocardia sp. GCM10023141 TaxID=3252653 RepID=UPI003612AD26
MTEVRTRRFDGKVVLITGIGRGQGRQHAVDFAREGAHVVGLDILEDIASSNQPAATRTDLDETIRLVEDVGGKIIALKGDVRDYDAVRATVAAGVETFGRLDVVVGNAGITPGDLRPFWELGEQSWRETIDVNLTGLFHTVKAAAPAMIEAGYGGAMVLTGSISGGKGWANMAHYCSTKFGLIGLMRVMAIELAPHGIRANVVSPTNVDTQMFMNPVIKKLFAPHLDDPDREEWRAVAKTMHLLDIGWVEPADISAAVRWICSDEARYVTGTTLPVDGGALAK